MGVTLQALRDCGDGDGFGLVQIMAKVPQKVSFSTLFDLFLSLLLFLFVSLGWCSPAHRETADDGVPRSQEFTG